MESAVQFCIDEMEKQGLTKHDVAIATGLPYSTVRSVLSPDSKTPTVQTIGPICAFLRISLDDIYGIIRQSDLRQPLNQETIDLIMAGASRAEMIKILRAEQERMLVKLEYFQTECDKFSMERNRMDAKMKHLQMTCVGLGVALGMAIVTIVMLLV